MEQNQKKRNFTKASLVVIIIVVTTLLFFVRISAIPKIEPYVNDFVNILTPEQETQINILCDSFEKNTSIEIAVVTLQNTEGQDRVIYANKIGDENGVGKKDKDNGIVIVWSMENEKGLALATGRGTESTINDAKAGRILREHRALFDEGKYYEGYVAIIDDIINETKVYSSANATVNKDDELTDSPAMIFIAIFVIGLVVLIFYLIDRSDRPSQVAGGIGGAIVSTGLSIGGRSGGVSFGGGSFGGGGARG